MGVHGFHPDAYPWCTRAATIDHDVFSGPVPIPLPDPPSRTDERPGGHLRPVLKVAVLVAVPAVVAKQLQG
ncbi:hypothetical protein [Streptomyces mirabilis]|uniref:hypothetical protein n=1 Tax=Streptomyces mirabilis TaxID=68239 RepID=UPI003649B8DA